MHKLYIYIIYEVVQHYLKEDCKLRIYITTLMQPLKSCLKVNYCKP